MTDGPIKVIIPETGADGPRGPGVLWNEAEPDAAPDAEDGLLGDTYFQFVGGDVHVWGPKTAAGWGGSARESLRGPQGIQGPVGPQGAVGQIGPQGEVGPQGPQGDRGWSPRWVVVHDESREVDVWLLEAWVDGQGSTPGGAGLYRGPNGTLVENIGDAEPIPAATAANVAFDNSAISIPGAPDTVQAALEGLVSDGRRSAALALPGQVVQEIVALSGDSGNLTSSASWVDAGLQASITPLFDDSVIEILIHIPDTQVYLASGTNTTRAAALRIYNMTADEPVVDEVSTAGITVPSSLNDNAWVFRAGRVGVGRYPVNSLVEQIFRVEHCVNNAQVVSELRYDVAPGRLILREIRQ